MYSQGKEHKQTIFLQTNILTQLYFLKLIQKFIDISLTKKIQQYRLLYLSFGELIPTHSTTRAAIPLSTVNKRDDRMLKHEADLRLAYNSV